MKKCMLAVILASTGLFAVAETGPRQEQSAEVKARIAENREAELRRTGGRVYKPGSQKGEISYVNCQSAAKDAWLQCSVDYFALHTKLKVTLKSGKFTLPKPTLVGTRTLFVIDDPMLPNLLCAPEDGWVMVNVAPLKCEKPAFFEARVKKELSRGFSYLCGAANSQYKGSLLEGITSPESLDQHVDYALPVDIFGRIQRSMSLVGITPAHYTAYINACRQGWASAPTNEYQKVIWEKVKAEANVKPTNPMKITKEKK